MAISGPASNEAYLWRQIPNQGFNLYGKGVVGPGSRESLDRAVNLHAGYDGNPVSNPTKIEVLEKPTHINNRWGDFGTDYHMNRGELRMTYGQQPVEYMKPRWQKYAKAKGVNTLLDQAGSFEPALMEVTHREAIPIGNGQFKPGEFLHGKLRTPGTVINAIKDADIGVTLPSENITHVLTSEAAKSGAAPTKLTRGMVIAHDALGVYTPLLDKGFLKKNKPKAGDKAAEALYKKMTQYVRIQENAVKYRAAKQINYKEAERFMSKAWQALLKYGKTIK